MPSLALSEILKKKASVALRVPVHAGITVMASRALVRVLCKSRIPSKQLPPTFLLPNRRHLSTITTTTYTTDPAPPPGAYVPSPRTSSPEDSVNLENVSQRTGDAVKPRHPQLSKHSHLPPPKKPLTQSLHLLASLAAQPPHYITAYIHARPYLLTEGDSVRLPFLMPNATLGTTLRLNRAGILGSRDYTYRGYPWVDDQYFVCRAVVTGVEQEPERVKIKKKQRQRRTKRIKSQHSYTTLRITELRILPEGMKNLSGGIENARSEGSELESD